MPTEIDEVDRRIKQLEIEQVAVAKDDTAAERREEIERELADLREQFGGDEGAVGAREGAGRGPRQAARAARRGARASSSAPSASSTTSAPPSCATARSPSSSSKLAEAEAHADDEAVEPPVYLSERVDADEIAEVVGKWTGIPVSRMLEGEVEKLIHMEERLHQRVIGQDEAVVGGLERAAPLTRRACRTRTARSARSCSSARPASARPSWPARSPSSCSTPRTRWSGSTCPSTWRSTPSRGSSGRPPATSATRRAASSPRPCAGGPYAVVLLDEIEKAHTDVFNVLLQVMDDGRLTDGQGRTVDFKNTVLIMTSNIPGGRARRGAQFKPEFINRLDDIVEFEPLTREQLRRDRRPPGRAADRARVRARRDRRADRRGARRCSATWATTRPTAPGRSSG